MPTDSSGIDLQASKKDLAQEYQGTYAWSKHNKIAKEDIRAMGVQNINDKSVEEFTKSEGSMEKIIIGTRCDLAIETGKGHHCNKNRRQGLLKHF